MITPPSVINTTLSTYVGTSISNAHQVRWKVYKLGNEKTKGGVKSNKKHKRGTLVSLPSLFPTMVWGLDGKLLRTKITIAALLGLTT